MRKLHTNFASVVVKRPFEFPENRFFRNLGVVFVKIVSVWRHWLLELIVPLEPESMSGYPLVTNKASFNILSFLLELVLLKCLLSLVDIEFVNWFVWVVFFLKFHKINDSWNAHWIIFICSGLLNLELRNIGRFISYCIFKRDASKIR